MILVLVISRLHSTSTTLYERRYSIHRFIGAGTVHFRMSVGTNRILTGGLIDSAVEIQLIATIPVLRFWSLVPLRYSYSTVISHLYGLGSIQCSVILYH